MNHSSNNNVGEPAESSGAQDPPSGQVTTRLAPSGDTVDLTDDREPSMLDIGNLLAGHVLDSGQDLMALVKPLSVTLLGGSRYRAVLKVGLPGESDGLASVLIDAAAHMFTVEGSLSEEFEIYADQRDPLALPSGERSRWFACRAVEAWIDRLMKSDALRETAIWVA